MFSIHQGDCREVMAGLDAESIDAIVTDPPYGLSEPRSGGYNSDSGPAGEGWGPRSEEAKAARRGGFMGKKWDADVPGIGYWTEAFRVLKPGAHLVAFGGSRTYHRLACAIEDAGFEIRDQLQWIYGQGFPKSHNLPGGLGTALKPSHEPIVLARKPLIGTVAANVAQHGTGALNIDGCRIGDTVETWPKSRSYAPGQMQPGHVGETQTTGDVPQGRWPANVVLDEEAGALLDAQSGERKSGKMLPTHTTAGVDGRNAYGADRQGGFTTMETYGDTGGASRFFYCPKSSRAERNAGLEGMPERMPDNAIDRATQREGLEGASGRGSLSKPRANHHPTVKPIALMRWLCRLITPPGGLILDPFLGSGTTGCAAMQEGFGFVGIEMEPEYLEIARRRIEHSCQRRANKGTPRSHAESDSACVTSPRHLAVLDR